MGRWPLEPDPKLLRVGLAGLCRADFVAILPRCLRIAATIAPHQHEKSPASPQPPEIRIRLLGVGGAGDGDW